MYAIVDRGIIWGEREGQIIPKVSDHSGVGVGGAQGSPGERLGWKHATR